MSKRQEDQIAPSKLPKDLTVHECSALGSTIRRRPEGISSQYPFPIVERVQA